MEFPKLEARRALRTAAECAEESWFAEAAWCQDSARVDYPRNVGENEFGTSLDLEWPGFRLFCFNRGPVAQLGARFHGMEEVAGSIPARSTKSLNNVDTFRTNTRTASRLDLDLGSVGHGFPYLVDFLIRHGNAAVRPIPEPMGGADGAIAVGKSVEKDVTSG
jgi:hypothetical protein